MASSRAALAQAAPLRVCLLGYRSNPFSGGQGIYLRYLSRALVELGHAVDVISGEPYPELDPRVNLIPLPGLNLYASPNHVRALRREHLRSFTDTFEWLSMLTGGFPEPYTFGRRVYEHLKSHAARYDVIHDNQSLGYGLLELQRRGFPVVATIHHPITRDRDTAIESVQGWGHRLAIRRWYSFLVMQGRVARRLKHLVTVSMCSRTDIAKAFGVDAHDVAVVANGIDTKLFRPLNLEPNLDQGLAKRPGRRLITTASADVPLKGLTYLLRALAALRTRHHELELTLIGRINADSPSGRLLSELGLAGAVEVKSELTPEQIVREYARADIAVVPSLYEGFGLPAGEAMACEVPVVATCGGALPEVVGQAGATVPPGDSEALAGAIEHLLLNANARRTLAKAGRERVLSQFSWARAAQQMTDLYRIMLDAKHPTNSVAARGNRRFQPT